jgi:integrase
MRGTDVEDNTVGGQLNGVPSGPTVSDYSERWLANRVDLAVRTVELYSWLLKRYVLPEFGPMALGDVTPLAVRSWNSKHAKVSPTTAAKAYRLFALIMRTAVADELIDRTPCHVRGAASERAPERPVATMSEAILLAEEMPSQLRIAVYLAAWCQLRRGEVRGLRRGDIDLDHKTLSVNETRTTTMSGQTIIKSPKTRAGRRTIAIPSNVIELLSDHLENFVEHDPESLVINASDRSLGLAWRKARLTLGRPELRFHDLRHSGLTWAAETGASLAELMRRAGHASQSAAIRYQHATDRRDRVLADALAGMSKPDSESIRPGPT